jgi:DNA-binding MarR family transcriptional regulator
MGKQNYSQSIIDLWLLLIRVNHTIFLIRQKELRHYQIPVRHAHILHSLKAIGHSATLAEVAKQAERKIGVITKQAVLMEKEGLIKRVKNTPYSNLLHLELTEKGLEMAEVSKYSKSINEIFASITREERQQMELILNKLAIKLENYQPD